MKQDVYTHTRHDGWGFLVCALDACPVTFQCRIGKACALKANVHGQDTAMVAVNSTAGMLLWACHSAHHVCVRIARALMLCRVLALCAVH